jgi:hypothetical protein
LQSVTVAVAQSDVEEFRILARVYCAHCAPDPDTADAMAVCAQGAITTLPHLRAAVDSVEARAEATGRPCGVTEEIGEDRFLSALAQKVKRKATASRSL